MKKKGKEGKWRGQKGKKGKKEKGKREKGRKGERESNSSFMLQSNLTIGHTPLHLGLCHNPAEWFRLYLNRYVCRIFTSGTPEFSNHKEFRGLTFCQIYIPQNTKILQTGEETKDITRDNYGWLINSMSVLVKYSTIILLIFYESLVKDFKNHLYHLCKNMLPLLSTQIARNGWELSVVWLCPLCVVEFAGNCLLSSCSLSHPRA